MADPIRVLIVDDHSVVREGLRAFLELQAGLEVVGEAADGEDAIEAGTRLRPDVILMDLVMPQLGGVAAMRRLRELVPGARIIVLTSFLDDDKLLPALRAGAAGYLLKNAEPHEIVRAVERALELLHPVGPPSPARHCSTRSSPPVSSRRSRETTGRSRLTDSRPANARCSS